MRKIENKGAKEKMNKKQPKALALYTHTHTSLLKKKRNNKLKYRK